VILPAGVVIVEFNLESDSSVAQIEEQIKLAVTMGVFKNGDRLPSIREVEKQTGINRGKIHRAYLSLKKSGLLVLAGRRGALIAAPATSARPLSQKCLLLSKKIIRQVSLHGIPPIVFARYLSRQAQEIEHRKPFLAFADDVKEIAERRAEEIARLWQVPVIGMTVQELKASTRKGSPPRKILANHLRRDYIRSMVSNKKIDVIPIEVVYTEQTKNDLARIETNSSVLRVLAQPYAKNAPFIIAQLRNWVKAPGVRISWISISDLSDIKQVLNGSRYDRVIMDPGILSGVPEKLLHNPRLLLIRMQLNPASLESARIKAGVII
jgi:GntR family transcriptional regulator